MSSRQNSWQEPIIYTTLRTFWPLPKRSWQAVDDQHQCRCPTMHDDLLFELEEIKRHPQHPMELSPFNSRLQRLLSSKTGANRHRARVIHGRNNGNHVTLAASYLGANGSWRPLWGEPERTLKLWQLFPTSSAKRQRRWVSTKEAKASWSSARTAWKQHDSHDDTAASSPSESYHNVASTLPAWSTGETEWLRRNYNSQHLQSSHQLCCSPTSHRFPPWPSEAAHLPALRHHLAPLAVQWRGCCPKPDPVM